MTTEKTQSTVTEIQKSQNIRLLDVFIIAPILIYAGSQKNLPKWLKISLYTIGVATAYYNGRNYLINKKKQYIVFDFFQSNVDISRSFLLYWLDRECQNSKHEMGMNFHTTSNIYKLRSKMTLQSAENPFNRCPLRKPSSFQGV